ncbi:transcriptional regulator, partial [Pseudomonas aeruginosa]|nr:transcriptional regulator [Pseudomonas aeruginosa]
PAWIHEVLQVTLRANGDWLQADAARLRDMDGRPQRASACCQ